MMLGMLYFPSIMKQFLWPINTSPAVSLLDRVEYDIIAMNIPIAPPICTAHHVTEGRVAGQEGGSGLCGHSLVPLMH